MIDALHISHVMGLKKPVTTVGGLHGLVLKGLPKTALKNSVARVAENTQERKTLMNRIVPEATYRRRRERLNPQESERTERLARVIATAEYVWGGEENARAFLKSAHPMLGGKSPLELAVSELGARQVEELLWKLFYGLPA